MKGQLTRAAYIKVRAVIKHAKKQDGDMAQLQSSPDDYLTSIDVEFTMLERDLLLDVMHGTRQSLFAQPWTDYVDQFDSLRNLYAR